MTGGKKVTLKKLKQLISSFIFQTKFFPHLDVDNTCELIPLMGLFVNVSHYVLIFCVSKKTKKSRQKPTKSKKNIKTFKQTLQY